MIGQALWADVPPLFGCRSYRERCRVRGWDQHLPGRILGALPQRQWVRRLQRLGQEVLVRLWRQVEPRRPATRRRWQWTWVADDRVFKKDGPPLGVVGTWYSGQEHRVRGGIDGLLRSVVIGDGTLVVPVDCVVRRPDPVGAGRPGYDQLTWWRVMLDRTWTALQRRCRHLPAPLVVADSWWGDAPLLTPVALQPQGTLVVEGKCTDVFRWPDGRRVTGQDFLTQADWPWRANPQEPGVRYVRLTATSSTYGAVTVIIVDKPGRDRFDLCCRATTCAAPRLIRAWQRRSWIEQSFRTLKHLLAPEACQVPGEDAYYGHLVLRLLAGLVLLYTARVVLKGRVTMEEMLFRLQHYWRFLDSELLELPGLSWNLRREAA